MISNVGLYRHEDGSPMSVAEWVVKNYLDFDPTLSLMPSSVEVGRQIAFDHASYGVSDNWVPYWRYGADPLSGVVAGLFAHKVGANKIGFQARLTGSGMNSIWVAMLAAQESDKPMHITSSTPLYGLTPDVLRRFGPVTEILGSDTEAIIASVKSAPEGSTKVLFLETIGNGIPMPVVDLRAIFDGLWGEDVHIVVDNTMATCHLVNPFDIIYEIADKGKGASPNFELVYLESLSKYYRCRTQSAPGDHGTAGIILAWRDFMQKCDPIISTGHAIQWPALREFPVDLFTASEIVMDLSSLAHLAARHLADHPLVKKVWYPDCSMSSGAGGVFYLQLVSSDVEFPGRMFQHLHECGSFGHPVTTFINFGKYGAPPGTVRIAIGTNETAVKIVYMVKGCPITYRGSSSPHRPYLR